MSDDDKEHYRHIMLFYYNKGKSAAQACEKIRALYGDEAVDEHTCEKWFQIFRDGIYDVRDAPLIGHVLPADK